MKKINSLIKRTIAISFCLLIITAGFSQKNSEGFSGWNFSLHAGAVSNNSDVHWNSPLLVNQVSNLSIGNTLIIVPVTIFSIPDTSMHNTGFAASLRIGYKKIFGHLLVGAEAGIGINTFKASQTSVFYPETMLQARNPLTIQRAISSGISKMLEGKFGYITGKHLIYIMAGFDFNPVTMASHDDYQLSFQTKAARGTVAAAPGTYNYTSVLHEQKETHTLIGMSWGVGYQYLVSEGVSVGVEYRQTGFGKKSYATQAVTGEQPVDPAGARVGVGGGLGASDISANLKQQIFSLKVDVALFVLFKK